MEICEIRRKYPKIADLAVEYFDEEFFEKEIGELFEGDYEVVDIIDAFKWDKSPQGYNFWNSIDHGNYEEAKKLKPELFDEHPSSKFKIGDKVRCIKGKHKGGGWKLNKEYIVDKITKGSSDYVYFPKVGAGVFEQSLELVSDKVPEYIEACINYNGYYIKGKIYKVIDKNFTNCTAVITNFDNEYKAGNNLYVNLINNRNWKPSTKKAYDAQIQTKDQFNVGDWVVFDINKAPDHLITQVWDKSYVLKVDKVFADNLEFTKETAIKAGMKNIIFRCSNAIRCFRKALPHEIPNNNTELVDGQYYYNLANENIMKWDGKRKQSSYFLGNKCTTFRKGNGAFNNDINKYRLATKVEREWLNVCIDLGKFVPKNECMFLEEIPVASKSIPTESFSFYKEYKPIEKVKLKQVKISSIKQFKFN